MVVVSGKGSYLGSLKVPGDKSISHRALLIAALSKGKSEIQGLSNGRDVLATLAAIQLLGAEVELGKDGLVVLGGISERRRDDIRSINVGNSGTLIRLGAGVTAGIGGKYHFYGDESVNSRPMERVFRPLEQMGARFEASNMDKTAPFSLFSEGLDAITYELPVASAQVKSAIIFAGLGADGVTTVVEGVPTRQHTEEMLADAGAAISRVSVDGATRISIEKSNLNPLNYTIPGDPSQAAFWIVGALMNPGSKVTVQNLYLGALRVDFLSVLQRMGAEIEFEMVNETIGHVSVSYSELCATEISGPEISGVIDEIPILCIAASKANGVTRVRDAKELRVKESDRIAVMAKALRSFGVQVEEFDDGLDIHGGDILHGGDVEAHLDHRIAMSAAILGSSVQGSTTIKGFESVESSYPGFLDDLNKLTTR